MTRAYPPWMRPPERAVTMNKRCSICGRVRRLKYFHKDKHKFDGRVSVCKDCRAKTRKQRMEDD